MSAAPTQHHLACPDAQGTHQVNYWQWGAVENPNVVVCLHGLTRNSRDFDFLAQALAVNYRVLCIDMAGRGDSEWLTDPMQYGYPLYVADVLAILADLQVNQVDWVGTSMGGLIGMAVANIPNSPIRRMVINDIGALLPKAALQRIGKYFKTGAKQFPDLAGVEAHLREVHAPFGSLTDAQWQHLARHSARPLQEGGYRLAYDPAVAQNFIDMNALEDIALWEVWENVHCPVLLLRGAESDLLLPETVTQMQRLHPTMQVVTLPNVGHAPALMDAEQIGLVKQWLDA